MMPEYIYIYGKRDTDTSKGRRQRIPRKEGLRCSGWVWNIYGQPANLDKNTVALYRQRWVCSVTVVWMRRGCGGRPRESIARALGSIFPMTRPLLEVNRNFLSLASIISVIVIVCLCICHFLQSKTDQAFIGGESNRFGIRATYNDWLERRHGLYPIVFCFESKFCVWPFSYWHR